jgi:type I site-specific restriction-modification system R (restriction) subunit
MDIPIKDVFFVNDEKENIFYVDTNLKRHGLVPVFSRTNRLLGEPNA